jgi:hypothetical protein
VGRNYVHELNREHVAAPAALILAGLRTELWKRFRDELARWKPRPLLAAVFGSAARGDGDEVSDIDLLLVHPLFPGEPEPAGTGAGLRADEPNAIARWEGQVDRLRTQVEGWSGNRLQVVDLSFHEWRRASTQQQLLLSEVERDGIYLVRARGMSL